MFNLFHLQVIDLFTIYMETLVIRFVSPFLKSCLEHCDKVESELDCDQGSI